MKYFYFRDVAGSKKRFADWRRAKKAKSLLSDLSASLGIEIEGGIGSGCLVEYDRSEGSNIRLHGSLHEAIKVWSHSKSPESPDVLYLVRAKNTRRYKIGITQNLKARIKTISTSSPFPVVLEASAPCANAKDAESWLHEKYSRFRVHGEWFEFSQDQKEAVIGDIESKAWE